MKHRRVARFTMKKLLMIGASATVFFVLLLYAVSAIYVYLNQDAMIFFPRPIDARLVESLKVQNNIEELNLRTDDGNTLRGWIVNADPAHKKPLVIYYGGNAEEVSDMISTADQVSGSTWALVNYRGYGSSTGSPSEANLFSDSLLVYDTLSARHDIDTTNISVFGRSLGSGVAVYVAQHRLVSRVLLSTPYDSLTSVAQEQYPYFPIGLLLKNKFDSVARASDIHVPVLILAVGNDKTIPISHAAKLAAAFGRFCTYKIIPGADHNTISNSPSYISSVEDFLGNQ